MTDDRRREVRAPTLIEVTWEGSSGRHLSRSSDISQNGCFIVAIARISLGETVNLRIHLPAEEPIEVQGEVVYCLPNSGFGVQFIPSMADFDWKRVERLIKA